MTLRELAAHYLRYYASPGEVAPNAPEELRRFVRAQSASRDRNSIHNAFANLAGQGQAAPVDTAAVWLATRPDAWVHCDEVLASKKPPKTWTELLERAYASAQSEIVDSTRKFLKDRLSAF